MRVALPHFGQSVLLDVSITFLRSAVFAIFMHHLLARVFRRAVKPGKKMTLNKNSGALSRTGNSPQSILHESGTYCLGTFVWSGRPRSLAMDQTRLLRHR